MLQPSTGIDNLIVVAYRNLTEAADALREACNLDQTIEQRKEHLETAKAQLDCAYAHFMGAVDSVPLE